MEEIRVLLVDDNAELRRTIQEQLNKQEGLHVIGECANGLEALEALGKSRVDVMVLDIIMPQMDGYALMEEVASSAAGADAADHCGNGAWAG